jgi:hypothetical protein
MKEIKAREGYYLTQVAEVGNDRLFVTTLKGANINEEDWREATEAEKMGYEEEAKRIEEEEAKRAEESVK